MLKIFRRAGLEPWKRVLHNLRASRQTELNQHHPAHVVCDWMGKSEAVVGEHYLHMSEADFQRTPQNPVQCPTVSGRNNRDAAIAPKENPVESVGLLVVTSRHTERNYPARTRTWNSRTKTCCVADYTTG